RRILPLEWLEADDWLPFQAAMLERHFAGSEPSFRRYMHQVCERDFNTFYKVVIRFLVSVESLLERTAKLWSSYAGSGKLEITGRGPLGARQRIQLRLDGFETEHRVFGVLVHAFVEQLLAMAGAKQVEVSRPLNQIVAGKLETELVALYS